MRINFLGGPGSGKSSTAAWLFSELKRDNISVELVSEFCKTWAIEGRKFEKYDQIYFFGQQMQAEYRNLKNGIKNTITDSPILLAAIYTNHYYGAKISKPLFELSREFDREYQCINIFLDRGDKKYVSEGRYENHEQALKMDLEIKSKSIYEYEDGKQLFFADYANREKIKELVYRYIGK